MQPPDGNQLRCPGQSLWSLIAEHVSGSELPKIRTALGHSLVDMYLEVRSEAEMWHKMSGETQRGGNHGSRAGTPSPRPWGYPLADPPAVKELVRAEVKMLLQTLRERASKGGRDDGELLFRYKRDTVNYALSHRDSCYSRCSASEDTDNGSRPSSHCSVQSTAEDDIEAMRDKLNVTEIDQVVDRLRSVLMGECEALTRLVKHLKGSITQKCESWCEFDKPEPSVAELKELRGAVQKDLELYPSSFAAPCPPPSNELTSGRRLSAGRSPETLPPVTSTPVLRPHPLPPLSCPKPRPPTGPPLTKTSLSRTPSRHRFTSASNKSSRMDTSEYANSLLTSDQVKSEYQQSFPPEQHSPGVHRRTPTSGPHFQPNSERNSPVHKTNLSSHGSIHSPSTECNSSPQRERRGSSAWRSGNMSSTPSPVPALSRLCDAGSYSSSRADLSVATPRKSRAQSGQQNSGCGGSLESTAAHMEDDTYTNTSWGPPAQAGRRKSNSGIDTNKNGHLRNDVSKQQSSVAQRQATCTQRPCARINRHILTSPIKPHDGTRSQPKSVRDTPTETQFLKKLYQPVPPARVPT